MNRDIADVIVGAASVALIAYGTTRWMSGRAAAERPRRSPAGTVYVIRPRIRVVSYAAAAFFIGTAIFAFRDGNRGTAASFGAFALGGFWFGTGKVLINATGITKKTLSRSQTLMWREVSNVVVHKRDGGAVELSTGSKKLIVDMRFVAPKELLAEIEERTGVQPVRDR